MINPAPNKDAQSLPTILIVDDEPSHLLLMTDWLKAEGHEAIAANGGDEALKLMDLRRPDLVLLDIRMPGMSGMDVLSAVRKDHPDIPVVMVTAVWDEKEGKKALRLGAFDYVTKPVNIEYLKTVIFTGLTLAD